MDYPGLLSLLQTNFLSFGNLECLLHTYHPDRYELYFDVVMENQRGAKFFAIPLFSRKSLLPCIDPPPYQRLDGLPVMVPYDSIDNFALPDLDWCWLWDSWHVLMLNDVDDQGWRYLTMFQRQPRWHGNYYFGDFVRQRTWIRMRHRIRVPEGRESENATHRPVPRDKTAEKATVSEKSTVSEKGILTQSDSETLEVESHMSADYHLQHWQRLHTTNVLTTHLPLGGPDDAATTEIELRPIDVSESEIQLSPSQPQSTELVRFSTANTEFEAA